MSRPNVMAKAISLAGAFVVFSQTEDDSWKTGLFEQLLNGGYSKDDLEELSDFCEQAGPVISEVHSSMLFLDVDP